MSEVECYIANFPEEVQAILRNIRAVILEEAPEAMEQIAYGMPAYKLKGKPLVYFAGYRTHVGFYATPTGHDAFREELANYKHGKGSVQFPLDRPIPYELIRAIVAFRVQMVSNP